MNSMLFGLIFIQVSIFFGLGAVLMIALCKSLKNTMAAVPARQTGNLIRYRRNRSI